MPAAVAIHATASPGEIRAVAVRDGRILDVAIERPGRPGGVGDVHRGRVVARVPALAGSFVALADAEGFLPDSAAPDGLSVGQAVAVRVVRAAQGGKGPRLDGRGLDPATPGPPALLTPGPGAVMRLASLHPAAPVRIEGAALLAALRPGLGDRCTAHPFAAAVEEQLAGLGEPAAVLDGGIHASFTPTPALVAIDLDTAGASADRRGKQAAQMGANHAALPDLARHIRARNLSGAIVVDLAGLGVKRRAALAPAFAAALAGDPLGPRFLGFSALGLAEILRNRTHPPLHELLAGPHAAGLAALRRLVRDWAAAPATVFRLRVAPDVDAALRADREAAAGFTHATGRTMPLHRDAALPDGAWSIEEVQRG